MVCFSPRHAFFVVGENGKKRLSFSRPLAEAFERGAPLKFESTIKIPCGQCIGCRIDKSRMWAMRIMHEASMYEHNSFLTLTVDDDRMEEVFPGRSLALEPLQLFLKRFRKAIEPHKIRYYACGEYGDDFQRPHYHLCVFGFDFYPVRYLLRRGQSALWRAPLLERLWPYGFSTIGSLTPWSAGYVARYCLKKVVGKAAEAHYGGRMPEFSVMSRRPGIGASWFAKYGDSDVTPYDEIISQEVAVKPPPYYDKLRAKDDPEGLAAAKESRKAAAYRQSEFSSAKSLAARKKMLESRLSLKTRSL